MTYFPRYRGKLVVGHGLKDAKNCQWCGKFASLKPGSKTAEFDTNKDFRKERPDVPTKTYMCAECGKDPEILKIFKSAPWYAGHRIL